MVESTIDGINSVGMIRSAQINKAAVHLTWEGGGGGAVDIGRKRFCPFPPISPWPCLLPPPATPGHPSANFVPGRAEDGAGVALDGKPLDFESVEATRRQRQRRPR